MNVIFLSMFFGLVTMTHNVLAWHNWAGNQVCDTITIVSPSSEKELQDIIIKAAQEKKKIRACGSGHSWSDIVCTTDYLINTDKLNNILSLDKKTNKVRVQAGIKLKDLVNYLTQYGLALANQPAILEQSVAGVIATATHGTGHTGTMADFITEVELVAADGTLHVLSEAQQPELFAASRVSIGSLGIIYAVTLQCEPAFMVASNREESTLQDMRNNYKKWYQENDFVQFFIDPYLERVNIDRGNRVDDKKTASWFSTTREIIARWSTRIVTPFLNWFPRLNRIATNWWLHSPSESVIQPSYKAFSGLPGTFYLEQEISIPFTLEQEVATPIAQLDKALDATLKILKEYAQKNIFISTILIRFVNAEYNSLLSPVAGRNSAFISVISPLGNDYEQMYRDLYHTLMTFEGRPHWGKINFLTQEDARKAYGENFEKFIAVRKQLDPDGLFSNAFTQRVFGW